MRNKPQVGEVWQHFKGNKYTVFTANATHTETGKQMVVYLRDGKVWVRPLEMFMDTVDRIYLERANMVVSVPGCCNYRFERVD